MQGDTNTGATSWKEKGTHAYLSGDLWPPKKLLCFCFPRLNRVSDVSATNRGSGRCKKMRGDVERGKGM